eukprot:4869438-Pyramimonas_sp.AAC.1
MSLLARSACATSRGALTVCLRVALGVCGAEGVGRRPLHDPQGALPRAGVPARLAHHDAARQPADRGAGQHDGSAHHRQSAGAHPALDEALAGRGQAGAVSPDGAAAHGEPRGLGGRSRRALGADAEAEQAHGLLQEASTELSGRLLGAPRLLHWRFCQLCGGCGGG